LLHQAFLAMVERGVKHLVVVGGGPPDGLRTATAGAAGTVDTARPAGAAITARRVAGVVTLGDLLRAQATGTLAVVEAIEREETPEGLRRTLVEADGVLVALLNEGVSPLLAGLVVAEFHDRVIRRVVDLAVARLREAGLGEPPAPFAWLQLGSGGRQEQVLRTDQDNALVYADPEDDPEAARSYFRRLAARVVADLETVGFARCPGNVMATNPALCRPLSSWQGAVRGWLEAPVPDAVRLAGLFFDFRPVSGDVALAVALRQTVHRALAEAPAFYYDLVRDDLLQPLPLGPFHRLVPERSGPHRGTIDLKGSACVHVVDCVRVFALRCGAAATQTVARLRRAVAAGVFPADEAGLVEAAFETLMELRLRENLRKLAAGLSPDNRVAIASLSEGQRMALRDALLAVARLRRITAEVFGPEGVRR
ncbi:MAG: hypothetical protein IRY95_05875, partial [Clostridia bacterium]|nr:hypothetical protein [Clostridia bacterium]